ncbi:fructosamine kinase family protein [Sedimenticola sp.]|uniref:fructosamine kinase family protein n=1 Tax=Sedimenticola sp. TaxID=1940285 RepID=UPI003D0B6787
MKAGDASLAHIVKQITGRATTQYATSPLGGGCINQALKLTIGEQAYFVKLNQADSFAMFDNEVDGLQALNAAHALRIPQVVCYGQFKSSAYLVLEFIPLTHHGDPQRAGRQLAALHRTTHDRHGWRRPNTLGATPQPNDWNGSWVDFWHDQRLGFQLQLAAAHGHRGPLQTRGDRLLARLPDLLNHQPAPSLLHGDLWSGNFAYDDQGHPVIYDPAVYFGDRETDLAMTELFGGFPNGFYDAYNEAWPLDAGYKTRKQLYNLYHILNHLNLFGGGYGQQALTLIDRLLAELED